MIREIVPTKDSSKRTVNKRPDKLPFIKKSGNSFVLISLSGKIDRIEFLSHYNTIIEETRICNSCVNKENTSKKEQKRISLDKCFICWLPEQIITRERNKNWVSRLKKKKSHLYSGKYTKVATTSFRRCLHAFDVLCLLNECSYCTDCLFSRFLSVYPSESRYKLNLHVR